MWRKSISALFAISLMAATGCSDDDVTDLIGGGGTGIEDAEPAPAEIAEDTTWSAESAFLLEGRMVIKDGATLTIEEGVTVYGSKEPLGWVQVERGGKIMAEGTAENPIVFTSAVTDDPQRGDWGGIVILGKAPNNVGTDVELEGNGGTHGGDEPTDSSGMLKYVRVEYAGWELSPDNELNGITLGSVGSGTTLSHVQVHYGLDDAIEWFGGTANGDHLVATGPGDDCFDTDQGVQTTVQYAVCVHVAGQGDNGIEASNQDPDIDASPRALPQFANFTFVGSGDYADGAGNGIRVKEGTDGLFTNGVVVNFVDGGFDLDDAVAGTDGENSDGTIVEVKSTIFFGNLGAGNRTSVQFTSDQDTVTEETFITAEASNQFLDPELNEVSLASLDLRPGGNSPALDCSAAGGPFEAAAYCGAFDDSDNWMAGWTRLQEGGVAASDEVVVSGDIEADTTWTADKTYLLRGRVSVVDGVTLTIEPGTTVKGTKDPLGWLQVQRGGKIMAEGTASEPIVFTSNAAAGERASGDWGGVVVLGKGINNVGTDVELEGNGGVHGGDDNGDNSGVLKYVRIEYAGWELSPDNELNGLTLGSVGNGTKMSYVQVNQGLDDGIEWFGGAVTGHHLVVSGADDDCFDTDQGVTTTVQFLVCIHQEGGGDNGIEASNQDVDIDADPRAYTKFANLTFIGSGDYADGEGNGLRFKEGAAGQVTNAVVLNFVDSAIDLDDYDANGENPDDGSGVAMAEILMYGNVSANASTVGGNVANDDDDTNETNLATGEPTFYAQDAMLGSLDITGPDLLPAANSPAIDGTCGGTAAGFPWPDADYCGAFNDTNWMDGWTNFAQN